MKVIFDDLANEEFNDTFEYYELQVEGLGQKFQEEIKRGLRSIKRFPEIGVVERGYIKRYIMHKFPFKILYSFEKNYIYVIAIAHMHREPNYWVKRFKS